LGTVERQSQRGILERMLLSKQEMSYVQECVLRDDDLVITGELETVVERQGKEPAPCEK
jgi:hypothetical protein